MTGKLPFRKPSKFAGLMSALDVNGVREKIKGATMPDPITAPVYETVPDNRPTPPKVHTLYLCRWWEWAEAAGRKGVMEWRLRTSMFPRPEIASVRVEANELTVKGMRRVEIIAIPGDL